MHEYDKNFATHKSNHDGGDMYHRERESIHHAHYRFNEFPFHYKVINIFVYILE